jgi:hypothetical protein
MWMVFKGNTFLLNMNNKLNYKRVYTFYNTLVRVESIDPQTVELIIPGWDTNEIISVDIKDVPIMFYGVLLDNPRMWANVNLRADKKEDLIIKDYKLV